VKGAEEDGKERRGKRERERKGKNFSFNLENHEQGTVFNYSHY